MVIDVSSLGEFLWDDNNHNPYDCSCCDDWSSHAVVTEPAIIEVRTFLSKDDNLLHDTIKGDKSQLNLGLDKSISLSDEIPNKVHTAKIDKKEMDTNNYFSYSHKKNDKPIKRIGFLNFMVKKINQLINFFRKLATSWFKGKYFCF